MAARIFNLIKKSFEKSFSKVNMKLVLDFMKTKIIEQAKEELQGSEKKEKVDKAVIDFVLKNVKSGNPIINAFIGILIDYIPSVSQCVYEYLKKYVDGLTEVQN